MDRVQIDRLEGERNWMDWKFSVTVQLKFYEVIDVVTGELTAPEVLATPGAGATPEERLRFQNFLTNQKLYKKADSTAMHIIVSSLRPEVRHLVNMCESAKEIWDKLHSVFEQKSAQRVDLLYEQLFKYKKDATDDIATHVSKLQMLWMQLQDEKIKLPESMLLHRILSTLPNEYFEFKSAWESTPEEQRTVAGLTERLRLVELRLRERDGANDTTESAALVAKANMKEIGAKKKGDATGTAPKKQYRPKCYGCGKMGHFRRDCKAKKGNKESEAVSSESKAGQAFIETAFAVNGLDDSSLWIADSGASHHMTKNHEWFVDYEAFSEPKPVHGADERQALWAKGHGTILVDMLIEGKWVRNHLKNAWYVPGIRCNLFSVSSATDHGLEFWSDSQRCEFRKGDQVLAHGVRQAGLLKMLLKVVIPGSAQIATGQSLQIWHERLGHQDKRHTRKFLKSHNIDVPLDDELCEACVYGKMHRQSFRARVNRPSEPGGLVHVDVCGPMSEKSLGGARYFVDFKDDFSKFRTVYFMKEKSEVKEKLKHFLAMAKTAGHEVKELLSDCGKEFVNSDVTKMLQDSGVHHRLSMPYTPEQNGGAERENRTLVELSRSVLFAGDLPIKLWAEAVNTTSYVLNRTGSTPIENMTPYEIWYGRKPTFDHFKVFGTECFVHVPKQTRRKWDRKAEPGLFVGYCGDKDGYRVWMPKRDVVILSRDVLFKKETTTKTVVESPCSHETRETQFCTPNSRSPEPEQNPEGEASSKQQHEGRLLRDRNKLQKPKKYLDYCMLAEGLEPTTYEEAIKSTNSEEWMVAMKEEMSSLSENQTWELVELPNGEKVLPTRWVFRVKQNEDGDIERFKARLVVKGCSQRPGIDYGDTFSPVARFDTIRTVLGVSASENLHLFQFDVKTAFLYGLIDETIYVKQPEGFHDGSEKVCRLLKSLYGLKQAPRSWNQKLSCFLQELGMKQSLSDPCLFYKVDKGQKLIIVVYVDDGLVASLDPKDGLKLLEQLKSEFKITIGSVSSFLGMQLSRLEDGSIFLNQELYLNRILVRFQMTEAHSIATPIEKGTISGEVVSMQAEENTPYREAVGSLMYLAVATRPDITFAVNIASQKLTNPTKADWGMVKRIFKYLKGTAELGLLYKAEAGNPGELEIFSDADYAGDSQTRKSRSGVVCKYSGAAVSWLSQKQHSVSLSTTEAEYVAASEAAKEGIWLKRLLLEIAKELKTPVIKVDSTSALRLIKNPEFHKRSKHIEVRYHFVREKCLGGEFDVDHVSSANQVADILTKALAKPSFEKLRSMLGVCSTKV